jgi:hypothetical protein
MPFVVGLDLGQSADYTALAVIQSVMEGPASSAGSHKALHLRHLERYPLRTPYPEIADKVAALIGDPALSPEESDGFRLRRTPPRLIVDATGVGTAVSDLLKTRSLRFTRVTITGGDKANRSGERSWRVPKRDLVASLEVPFHKGSLKVAEGLQLWPALQEELMNFRRKINLQTAHDSYEHWRDSDHDDLVLATALACWDVTRPRQRLRMIR